MKPAKTLTTTHPAAAIKAFVPFWATDTAKPAIGVAKPGVPTLIPIIATIIPDIAPPMKLVTYTGIGLADIISDWVNGSIATAIVSFLEPNFILEKNT